MSITQTELQSYLHDQLKEFEAKAGIANDLTSAGYKRILQNTIQKLGLGYSNSVDTGYVIPDGQENAAQIVGEVYTLERLERVFGSKKDFAVSGAGETPEMGILYQQVRTLLFDAYARAGEIGFVFPIATEKGMTLRTMRTDWIEGRVTSDG